MSKLSRIWTILKDTVRPLLSPGLWQNLRIVRIRLLKILFRPYVTKQRFGDVELRVRISDPLALDWYGQGGGLLTEIQMLKKSRLQDGARVFNAGAHQGVVALQLAHHVGPTGVVVAVEANRYNIPIAQENCDLNGAHNVVVEHAAVASEAGWVSFSRDWDGQAVGRGRCKVPAITIDELQERYGQPDVLYIDVEGYECEVLAGASKTLAHLPDLYIEVHAGLGLEDFGGSVEKLLSYLSPDDHDLFAIRPAESPDDVDYVSNFDPGLNWIHERFYLVALVKRRTSNEAENHAMPAMGSSSPKHPI